MEALEAIKSVKSVSKYKPDPVPEQKVQAVVNAARFAVSADNIQPWKFIVVSDEDAKRKLAGACTNGRHMTDAPLVVVACARLDEAVAMIGGYMNSYPVDLGMALANVTMAATSEGLGTSWIFTFNEEKVKSLLNIPADAHVVGLTPLGIPEANEVPAPPNQESPEEEYLRRILQLSREKARSRGAPGGEPGAEPASLLEADRAEGEMEESLWKLAEPFDRMLERRKQRLEQMEELIEQAQARIKTLAGSENPDDIRERDELKREIEKREELMREKARLLDERHHALSEAEVDLERRRWDLEQKSSAARAASKDEPTPVTIKSDQELGALQSRMIQLEEQMERLMEERNQLMEQQKELLNLKGELKVVMKDIDELLGDLPKDKIRKFAKSEKFALYEKLLEQLQLL